MEYPIAIVPLSEDDGGGFLSYAPDLPGCMSDGDTPGQALDNLRQAISEWLEVYRERHPDLDVPEPHSASKAVQAEREHLTDRLRKAIEANNALDDQLELLARDIEDIRERIENIESWSRFAQLAAPSTLRAEASKALRPS